MTSIHFHYILIGTLCGEIPRLLKFKVLNSITFVQNQSPASSWPSQEL